MRTKPLLSGCLFLMSASPAFAQPDHGVDLTSHPLGIVALVIFLGAYLLVVLEETTAMRKSKPVLVAAGMIWALIGIAYAQAGLSQEANAAAGQTILDYGELFLFVLVAITYVNTLEERRVFEVLRANLVKLGLSYRSLFWLTGIIAFFLSSVLDNLTTVLVMGGVTLAIGKDSRKFLVLSCIGLVVAANAGGAFCPFGDITTLMVWQKNKLSFFEFFYLFLPSAVNYVVPAALMHFAVPNSIPLQHAEKPRLKPGGAGVIILFAATIVTAISFRNFLGLQPALGMMLGLGYLQILAYALQVRARNSNDSDMVLDSFSQIARVEWDTLLFFFGVIFAVGGLGVLGYLELLSQVLYVGHDPTLANIVIGLLSSIVDNIPLMFAVLTMDPSMSAGQWLLVTLTTGVGGSLLSVGSAAGVALMGQAKGVYTFRTHLKWTWAIAAGYAASILVHLALNRPLF